MNWESFGAFLDMGGAGFYVWGSYGLTAVLVVLELIMLRARRISSTRRLTRLQRATSGRHTLPEAQS